MEKLKIFSGIYKKMYTQLCEINDLKKRGFDVSVVKVSFLRLADEVDRLWLALTEREKNGFETANTD